MPITLTPRAAEHVRDFSTRRAQPPKGLRLGIKPSGCSGLAYVLEFADDIRPDEHTFESHGITVIVDPKSLPHIDGAELDYAKEGLQEGFKFNNPNVKSECGCGESFTV